MMHDLNLINSYFENVERIINSNTIPLEKQPGNYYLLPTITELGSYTNVLAGADISNLAPPSQNVIKEVKKTDEDQKIIVVRRILPYSTVSSMMQNPSLIAVNMAPFITEMLLALKKARGFGHETLNAGECYARFSHPILNKYLIDLGNSAGYEVRLYSNTWSCIQLEGESNDTVTG